MFKQGDRVVLQSDFTFYEKTIPANTLGTITIILNEEMAIVRYGHDGYNDRQLVSGIPVSLLRNATEEELKEANYQNLVSPNYHVGKKVLVGAGIRATDGIQTGDVGVISEYQLELNEQKDILKIDFTKPGARGIKLIPLILSFVETYCNPYSEELESKLGEEIDFKKVEKNYHLVGARMFLHDDNPDSVVILTDKKDDGQFEVLDVYGVVSHAPKKDLYPITNVDIFLSEDREKFVRPEFAVGKRFKARENIVKHALLNINFQPGDVIKITYVDTICVNSFDDTFVVERTGMDSVILSALELLTYFDEFKGMVKQSKGKIEKVITGDEDILSVMEKEMLNREPQKDEGFELQPPVQLVFDTVKDEVEIHDLTINGFRFKNINEVMFSFDAEVVKIEDIDKLIRSLNLLKEMVKRG